MLPEKIKKSEILKYLHEITNIFSNMLWVAGILAFVGFGLTPNDPSNVYFFLKISWFLELLFY